MMKVLVLGLDEFIGGRVGRALAASAWARPVGDAAGLRAAGIDGVEPCPGALADAAAMAAALRGADAVVNCVSSGPRAIRAAAAAVAAAVATTASTKDSPTAGRQGAGPLVIHLSSMSVYGAATGDVDEDAALSGALGPYAQAKVDAEAMVRGCARRIILRPGCEYGPGGELWSGRIARLLAARRLGDLGAPGDGYCNLVHVDDIAGAVLRCLQRPQAEGGTFNLAMADPPTWNAYLVGYARALGAVPVRRISARRLAIETRMLAIPLKAIEIAARRMGAGAGLPPPLPPSLLCLMGQEIRLLPNRAQQVLDWRCRPLAEGLAQTAGWYRRPSGVPGS